MLLLSSYLDLEIYICILRRPTTMTENVQDGDAEAYYSENCLVETVSYD